MVRAALSSLAIVFLTVLGAAQERLPQHVAFVGKPAEARARAYVTFLKARFRKVSEHSRYDVAPKELAAADVVVVDWPQGEGVMKWFGGKAKPSCPLGERKGWRKPTVLLGSAGLNLACAWEVKGGSG